MKRVKSNLDERQEQLMLKIEHRACWLVFWGLLAAIVIQIVVSDGFDYRYIVGEWIVFLAQCVYICFACIKNGVWDRKLKPNAKTNLIGSLIAAVAVGAILFVRTWLKYPDKLRGAVSTGLISAAVVFVLCFATMSLMAYLFRRKQRRMEQEPEEENETE